MKVGEWEGGVSRMTNTVITLTKSKIYLTIYNVLQAIGWSVLLIYVIMALIQNTKFSTIYSNTIGLLAALQTISLLEIIHSIIGIVRSQVSSNIVQIFSRLFVIWIACIYSEQKGNVVFIIMLISWCVADITRYVYYVFNVFFESVPKWLEWSRYKIASLIFRYSFFIILYPIGTLGEMILINLVRYSSHLRSFNIPIFGYLIIYPFGTTISLKFRPVDNVFSYVISEKKNLCL